MSAVRSALLLFSKFPRAGQTKTRLTVEREGILSGEEAADLYEQMLLDVAERAFLALSSLANEAPAGSRSYDLIVSCSPQGDLAAMEELFRQNGPWPAPIQFITDRGRNFDEHFYDAFRQLFSEGYDQVVAIGGDLPVMPIEHLTGAFAWLDRYAGSPTGCLVLAPCQESGVSVVGMTRQTPVDFTGIFYNLDGVPALDGLVDIAREKNVPLMMQDPVADVDDPQDLAHTISLMRTLAYAAAFQSEVVVPKRTLAWVERQQLRVVTPPNENHDTREEIDA
jgi:glycosyltransferase A (GT-A) superfamily protein (DUF2064 family)